MLKKASVHNYDYILLLLAGLLPTFKKQLNYFSDVDYPTIGLWLPFIILITFLALMVIGYLKSQFDDYLVYSLRFVCIVIIIQKVLLYILY